MHSHGGKLYEIKITNHVLCDIDIDLNGLNPFESNPSLTFRGYQEKSICASSNFFQALLSAGCHIPHF